jgi:energy-coupling factor transport system permease protein
MREARLPPRIGYALFAALNLVPDLAQAAQELRLARAMTKGRPPARVPGPREVFSLMLPLLAFALRRAGRVALALEARGLKAGLSRTLLRAPRLHRRDALFATAALVLLVAGLALTIAL